MARSLARTTVRDALDSAVIALTAAGCETPRLDAEVLLAAALGVDRATLIAQPGRELDGAAARRFADFARRRREREPVAYILGRKGFCSFELLVDRRVLVPRPETEHVVEAALGLPRGARVVDVGTGSGAIALALKQERPDLEVLAGLDAVDAVVSNPPYVPSGTALMPEIARYEPAGALFAAHAGLAVIERLAPAAAAAGAAFLALEIGAGQAPAVAEIVRAAGFGAVERIRDLAGIERVIVGRR